MICVLTNLLRHFGANEVMKGVGLGVVASSSWDQHTHTTAGHTHNLTNLLTNLLRHFGANGVMKGVWRTKKNKITRYRKWSDNKITGCGSRGQASGGCVGIGGHLL
ncbi:hypothetical protein Pmani_003740 [Petrolisthes manimaculis]|uniref:Uncharacterized protein n=1 Tax=Petrolisthes manimaculis TaxID=1843537 RepID=A0AAE1QI56_9EUCA|nr:hypothetical protein Pmani_003740 [Petrolisthes manimaculis]